MIKLSAEFVTFYFGFVTFCLGFVTFFCLKNNAKILAFSFQLTTSHFSLDLRQDRLEFCVVELHAIVKVNGDHLICKVM